MYLITRRVVPATHVSSSVSVGPVCYQLSASFATACEPTRKVDILARMQGSALVAVCTCRRLLPRPIRRQLKACHRRTSKLSLIELFQVVLNLYQSSLTRSAERSSTNHAPSENTLASILVHMQVRDNGALLNADRSMSLRGCMALSDLTTALHSLHCSPRHRKRGKWTTAQTVPEKTAATTVTESSWPLEFAGVADPFELQRHGRTGTWQPGIYSRLSQATLKGCLVTLVTLAPEPAGKSCQLASFGCEHATRIHPCPPFYNPRHGDVLARMPADAFELQQNARTTTYRKKSLATMRLAYSLRKAQ